ncbi:hypothetical protein I6M34_14565 [Shewanella algae]|uniref:hypothetical protein n=1 Tax=Shewanella algae TaxID=38313 RepID=UPI001AAC88C6|nr:hypothetical protein [Shewanella algae]MBO2604307.1 hypothetical protein [Shewanella algae]
MGISKPSQGCVKHQKDMAVLYFRDGEVRQTLTISGEKKMINQKANFELKAFETNDKVLLSQEEAQSGKWQLIGD